ncbi:MAG: ankyrin repeat domain-containing protein [Pyrinomonadaceae bacterium]|nr:ankyrin repeat domain-containing protein [Pyrinomonadaceae bacterium]
MRKIFIITIFLLSFSAFANGQAIFSYVHLEVADEKKEPVPGALIEITDKSQKDFKRALTTNENGVGVIQFTNYAPNYLALNISRNGYFPFRDIIELIPEESLNLSVEMLKIHQSNEEEISSKQIEREFLWAIKNGDMENVKIFLKKKIKVNWKEKPFQNILPFYLSANPLADRKVKNEKEKAELLQKYEGVFYDLIKAGADVYASDKLHQTTLIIAVKQGYLKIVKTLLKKNLPVNAKDYFSNTALIYAKAKQQQFSDRTEFKEIIKLLEAAGAK